MRSKDVRNLPREATEKIVDAILDRIASGCALSQPESHFIMGAYKTQSQEERSLSQKQNQLSDATEEDLLKFLRSSGD